MDSKTVTIRDVAEGAGVSQSTVSRVLNSSETQIPISRETRQRVQRVAEELGYRPHVMHGVEREVIGAIGDERGKARLQASINGPLCVAPCGDLEIRYP